jgi:hypothetical protein
MFSASFYKRVRAVHQGTLHLLHLVPHLLLLLQQRKRRPKRKRRRKERKRRQVLSNSRASSHRVRQPATKAVCFR